MIQNSIAEKWNNLQGNYTIRNKARIIKSDETLPLFVSTDLSALKRQNDETLPLAFSVKFHQQHFQPPKKDFLLKLLNWFKGVVNFQ